jgi:MFS family permease
VTEAEATLPAAAAAPGEATRNPFATKQFRWYWAAVVCGAMGVGIQVVTVPLFVRDRVAEDHRELLISLALISQTVPAAILMLFGGVASDRFQRQKIMTRVWFSAALVSVAYVVLTGAGVSAVWPVFILAAIVGSLDAFGQPARFSMPPQILPQPQVQNGIILNTVAFMTAFQFLGPSLGGLLSDVFNLTTAFAVEVAFLLTGALLATRIRVPKPVPTGKSVWADLADGVRYVRGRGVLIMLLFLQFMPGAFLIGPFRVTGVAMVNDILGGSDKFVGFLSAGFGLGALLGSVALTMVRPGRRGLLLCLAFLPGGVIFMAYGLSTWLPLSLALMIPWGLSAAVHINMITPLIQESAEPRMLGRVMSMSSLCFAISTPIGFAHSGLVANWFGPEPSIIASGAIFALVGVLCLLFMRPVRTLR